MVKTFGKQSLWNSGFMAAGIGSVVGLAMIICWPFIPESKLGTIATVLTAFATLIAALVALHAARTAMSIATGQEIARKAELAQSAKALAFAIHQELWDVLLIAKAIERRRAEGPKQVWELRKHYRERVSIPILLSNAQTLGWFEPAVGSSLGSSIGSTINLRKLLFAPIFAPGRSLPAWYVDRLVEAGRRSETDLAGSCELLRTHYGVPPVEDQRPPTQAGTNGGSFRQGRSADTPQGSDLLQREKPDR